MNNLPDGNGHFGKYGGRYVPDTLFEALLELEIKYNDIVNTDEFQSEYNELLKCFVGRPTPLFYASRLSDLTGFHIYLKREDLNHTGAHKINNALGQALLAKYMGKNRIIAETGAGQHGVATATACSLLGLQCVIYMGEEDIKRQQLNVYRMQYLGAKVSTVESGSRTLKDATTEAIRDWLTTVETTHYIIGSVVGPHPYPKIVRNFQSIIGKEARQQCLEMIGQCPDSLLACVGGGSNAIGLFYPFLSDNTSLVAVEAAGDGVNTKRTAAALTAGIPGIFHGCLSYLLQDDYGQVQLAHSISAGLDYPGIGPELSYLFDKKRILVETATDKEALDACKWLSQFEGIIPALETAHALSVLKRKKPIFKDNDRIVVNLSGRGDKDMETLMRYA